ncbi:MAG: acyloxyacyl hydrolase, partial [Cytophagales bacterium]|nr:acyloxyacyl hydrolase [Cytophagales bacterium]
IWVCFFTMCSHLVSAQGLLKNAKYIEVGGLVGFGKGMDALSVPEGSYDPTIFVGHFSMDLIKQEKLKGIFPGRFLLVSEPQINYVNLKSNPVRNEWEFGLTTLLQYMYPVLPRMHIYVLGGSGPFWFSASTVTQKQGFIFCNYFGIGLYIFPFKDDKLSLNIGFRARHMSNANIWFPNNGINAHLITIGFSKFLK